MKEKTFLKIEDMMYVAAMGPPGGFSLHWTQFTCFTSTKVQILTPEEKFRGQDLHYAPVFEMVQCDFCHRV